jgi:RNA polymerase sigma-70 factor (ECF subfamily)
VDDTNPPVSAVALETWVDELRESSDEAIERLHGLLLRAARFEVRRRAHSAPELSQQELEELAQEAASDAAVSVLRRLDDFRGESRFTTWAYKFALLEAATKVRRRAWRDREIVLDPEAWERVEQLAPGPDASAEHAAFVEAVREGIRDALTARQRFVLVSLTLDGVPIDVLAERLDSNRNALYKTLHDARRRLREHLTAQGHLGGSE